MLKSRNPDVVKILGICDPHFAAHNPASYKGTQNYLEVLTASVRRVFKYASKEEADAVVWAGDIFHLKAASRNPLWFLAKMFKLMLEVKQQGMANVGIAGNHDLKYGSLAGLGGQPLELLVYAGAYGLLDHERLEIDAGSFEVTIGGQSFNHGSCKELLDVPKLKTRWSLGVGHFWFGTQSGELFGEPIFGPDALDRGPWDAYLIGHHHVDQGCQYIGKKHYLSPGSITRTGVHKDDLQRRPAAVFVTFTQDEITPQMLRPTVPEPDDIFDLTVRQQVLEERERIEEFMHSLTNFQLATSDPAQMLAEMNVLKEVRDRTLEYLEKADAD